MFQNFKKSFLLAFIILSVIILPKTALADCSGTPTIIYVDATAASATPDGSSWTNAYTSLQDALDSASSHQIWVAAGIYYPDEGMYQTDNDRDATFQLANCVAIYGGFPSGGSSWDDRDWITNVTILSGDIDQDDDSGGNSYHVVSGGSGIDETAILDGFVISGGNANGGGACLVSSCGGGMLNDNSSPTLTNVTFSGNTANFYGGGMYNNNSSPTLTNVTLSGNTANYEGGGMYNNNSSPILTNITFSGNTANTGGGMYNYYYSNPTLTNVTFSENTANGDGGGMYNEDNNSPTLTNVTFSGNTANSNGGGMYNDYYSNPTLTNVILSGNTANYDGGGMYNYNSSPTLINVIIWANQDQNGVNSIHNARSSTPTISYSLIQGSGGSTNWESTYGANGGNNIDDDPSFVTEPDPNDAPSTTGDLHLKIDSPAINVGDNSVVTVATDLDGNPRIVNEIVDMGAYEVTDRDGDGYDDDEDNCPDTEAGELVDETGCSIKDFIELYCDTNEEGEPWNNHGEYVRFISHKTIDFMKDGIITAKEKGKFMATAAASSCGK